MRQQKQRDAIPRRRRRVRRLMGLGHPIFSPAPVTVICPHCRESITGPWIFTNILWVCPECGLRWTLTNAGKVEAREWVKNVR
jgi:rubredoxin